MKPVDETLERALARAPTIFGKWTVGRTVATRSSGSGRAN